MWRYRSMWRGLKSRRPFSWSCKFGRFLDGSRKLRAISECLGLDDKGNYRFQDLYRFEARGISPEGRLLGEMLPTGISPTFADEVAQMGYQDRVKLTRKLFSVGDATSVVRQLLSAANLAFGCYFFARPVTAAESPVRDFVRRIHLQSKTTAFTRRYEDDHETNQLFRKFHSDEEGLEALQVVMIIAIAAVILVAAGTVGQSVVDFTKTKLNALKDKQVNG